MKLSLWHSPVVKSINNLRLMLSLELLQKGAKLNILKSVLITKVCIDNQKSVPWHQKIGHMCKRLHVLLMLYKNCGPFHKSLPLKPFMPVIFSVCYLCIFTFFMFFPVQIPFIPHKATLRCLFCSFFFCTSLISFLTFSFSCFV